jgi:ethanolamine ammonia-lyase small subunit
MGFFLVNTMADSKETYLKRPDQGRKLTEAGRELISSRCVQEPEVQIVISDGLSVAAVEASVRDVYLVLLDSLRIHGLSWGTTLFVKNGRVACMDQVGDLLRPQVLVLLIGERPGLVSARSLSAYMGYSPRTGMMESDRNVISNIHAAGTPPIEAGAHIGSVLKAMLDQRTSGISLMV